MILVCYSTFVNIVLILAQSFLLFWLLQCTRDSCSICNVGAHNKSHDDIDDYYDDDDVSGNNTVCYVYRSGTRIYLKLVSTKQRIECNYCRLAICLKLG